LYFLNDADVSAYCTSQRTFIRAMASAGSDVGMPCEVRKKEHAVSVT